VGGAAVGNAVGPFNTTSAASHASHDAPGAATDSPPQDAPEENLIPAGLTTSEAGYTLEPERTDLAGATGDEPFRFRITSPDGEVVRAFESRHERELHLIVVDRDLTTFSHLHPTRADDGTWSVVLGKMKPGVHRAFADFVPSGGPDLTLGVDLAVAGDFRPAPLPSVAGTDAADGYEVTLGGAPTAGSSSEVTLEVSRDGQPVTDLDPYLGANGHLVAIRAGDLAYLHVHPLETTGKDSGPTVRFAVEVPSPGTYRLFFDFAHGTGVHTADFTVDVSSGDVTTDSGNDTEGHGANHEED